VQFSIDSLFRSQAVAPLLGPVKGAYKEIEIKDPATIVIHLKQPAIFPCRGTFSCATGAEGMNPAQEVFSTGRSR